MACALDFAFNTYTVGPMTTWAAAIPGVTLNASEQFIVRHNPLLVIEDDVLECGERSILSLCQECEADFSKRGVRRRDLILVHVKLPPS